MSRSLFSICLALASLVLAAPRAAAKPNFTGVWKMAPAKSDFGAAPAPASYEQKIEHNDSELKVVITEKGGPRGDQSSEFRYNTRGRETANSTARGEVKSKARWQGDVLVIDSKLDIQGNIVAITESYELAADGASLTFSRKVATPGGDLTTKIVMEKQ